MGHRTAAVLGECRPIVGNPVVVIEVALGVGVCHLRCSDAFRRRKNKDEGVLRPRFRPVGVAVTAPEIYDEFAAMRDGTGGTEFAVVTECLAECCLNGFETGRDVASDRWVTSCHCVASVRRAFVIHVR